MVTTVTSTTGVIGLPWRADVTTTGSIIPWDRSPVLHWYVAADDRWHDPSTDSGVRHRRVDGVAVFETKVRIPGGDAVQRVWSVADRGGFTLVEVHNDSPLPIACAFTRPDVVASRLPASVPIRGIEVPDGSVVLPVGHRSGVVVGLSHGAAAATVPPGLPSPEAVGRGWIARADAASRLELPDVSSAEAVRAARCEALLCGPPAPGADPERYLLTVAELVRMGDLDERRAVSIVDDIGLAVERVARGTAMLRSPALAAAAVVLAAAGEKRAVRDLRRFTSAGSWPDRGPAEMIAGIEVVAAIETQIAAGPVLFPRGIPRSWLGTDFEAHGLVAGPASRLSLAVRWHGPNAAVLWELTGAPVTLTAPSVPGGWSSDAARGEALWVLGADHNLRV